MRRILLFLIIAINLLIAPSAFAASKVIIDRLSASAAEDLNIQIPDDVPPGFHSLTIEVYDAKGTVSTKEILFCKKFDSTIAWDNKCPGMVVLLNAAQLEAIKERAKLPNYLDPMEPKKHSKNQAAAYALLALLATSGTRLAKNQSGASGDTASAEMVDTDELRKFDGDIGWGDTSRTWNWPSTSWTDRWFVEKAERSSKKSPLFARILGDGGYLRAMLGSLSTLLYPVAVLIGLIAAISSHFQAMPPHWTIVAIVVVLGVIDSLAGLIAAASFAILILLTGNLTNVHELITVFGLTALFWSPTLIAAGLRPFRRDRSWFSEKQAWERAADFLLAALIGGWVTSKIITGLNGLGAKQFALNFYAGKIGFIVGAAILIRILVEELASHFYPQRLSQNTPIPAVRSRHQQLISLMVRFAVFLIVASFNIGGNVFLVIGGIIFITPSLFSLLAHRDLPKSERLGKFLPSGTLLIVLLTLLGGFFAQFLHGFYKNQITFLQNSFVYLGIPMAAYVLLSNFAAERSDELNTQSSKPALLVYRVGGLIVLALFTLIAFGVDLTSVISGWFTA